MDLGHLPRRVYSSAVIVLRDTPVEKDHYHACGNLSCVLAQILEQGEATCLPQIMRTQENVS